MAQTDRFFYPRQETMQGSIPDEVLVIARDLESMLLEQPCGRKGVSVKDLMDWAVAIYTATLQAEAIRESARD